MEQSLSQLIIVENISNFAYVRVDKGPEKSFVRNWKPCVIAGDDDDDDKGLRHMEFVWNVPGL